MEARPVQLIAL